MRVFLTGGTGLVGREIIWNLCERGDSAVVLTRNKEQAADRFAKYPDHDNIELVQGDPSRAGKWQKFVDGCDAAINLAGEPVFAKRWSKQKKQRLYDSRVDSTNHLVAAISGASNRPTVLASASAIGFYGNTGEAEITEDSPAANDDLGKICVDWEAAADAASAHGVRVAKLRIGIVLDEFDGALATMQTPFKLGLGGPIGRGAMWMSWVHVADVAGVFLKVIDDDEISGPINVVSPNPVRNKDFSKSLAKALHRPCLFPVPPFMLKLLYGESAAIILASQKVLPRKLEELDFAFQHSECPEALKSIFTDDERTS
ncbi:MAG: TIGR01777 family oxidoreductase [Pirellulales bacterium]|nr:TIGR01777 family oxidoreductase [Pirellulales bacterium]